MSAHTPARPGTPLTAREREVLTLAADGLSGPEIGKKLFIGVDTVRTHLHAAYVRLGAKNRAHAVNLAYRSGALTVTGPRISHELLMQATDALGQARDVEQRAGHPGAAMALNDLNLAVFRLALSSEVDGPLDEMFRQRYPGPVPS